MNRCSGKSQINGRMIEAGERLALSLTESHKQPRRSQPRFAGFASQKKSSKTNPMPARGFNSEALLPMNPLHKESYRYKTFYKTCGPSRGAAGRKSVSF